MLEEKCAACGGTKGSGEAVIGPIDLAWPRSSLSPNARVHWATKASVAKVYRTGTFWQVRAVVPKKLEWEKVCVSYTFHPPDKRRRDLDNLIASCKALSDGISDAIGIDDSKFVPTYQMGEPIKGGAVIVTIEEMK